MGPSARHGKNKAGNGGTIMVTWSEHDFLPTLPSAELLSSTMNFCPVLSFIFGKDDITFGLVASELVLSDFSCISGWVKLSVIAYKLFINFTSHLFSFVHSTLEIF